MAQASEYLAGTGAKRLKKCEKNNQHSTYIMYKGKKQRDLAQAGCGKRRRVNGSTQNVCTQSVPVVQGQTILTVKNCGYSLKSKPQEQLLYTSVQLVLAQRESNASTAAEVDSG